MSDQVKRSWQALGEKMSSLGSAVQHRINAPADAETAPARAEAGSATDQVKAALDEVVAATRELGERIGDAARDDDVRATAKDAMASLDEALRTTVDFIADEVEGVVKPSPKHDET